MSTPSALPLPEQGLGAGCVERLRVARELHDGPAQLLTYMNAQALTVARLLEDGQEQEALTQVAVLRHAVRQAHGEIREMIAGLRSASAPVPSSRCPAEGEPRTAGRLEVRLPRGRDRLELPAATALELVRVLQEALVNARRHADATAATVRVSVAEGRLVLEVQDNGCGFDPAVPGPTGMPHFGLQTMRERAQAAGATFQVRSTPGVGTRVTLAVPLLESGEVALAGAAR